jgi:radical SAM-linked protein
MRYTGHLDLQRAIERNFRRSGLPLEYSQGFNPRPKLVFASPLPLGYTSEGELAEAWLGEAIPPEEILALQAEKAPPGIVYRQIEPVSAETPKLPNRVAAAEYKAAIRDFLPDLDRRIADLLEAERIPRERGGKPYDLRPLVEKLSYSNPNGAEETTIEMRLMARPGATGRPEEVFGALGIDPGPVLFHRTQILLSGDPP